MNCSTLLRYTGEVMMSGSQYKRSRSSSDAAADQASSKI